MQIIPSILVQSEEEFKKQITSVEDAIELVQIDIADGKFVNNKTWANSKKIEKYTDLNIELHLMVENPLQELKKWSTVEQIKRILVHYESVENLEDIMPTLHAYGWEIGIVLNPDTKISVLKQYIPEIKTVMFMGVIPGLQGQKLIPKVLEKISKFKSLYPTIFTELDGGVNKNTLLDIIKSGVDAICPGSAIFGNDKTAEENIEEMQNVINKLT